MNTSKNGFNKIDESVHSEMFDSATTRSVGRGLCLIRTSVYLKWLQVKYLLAIVLQLALSTRLVMYVYLSEQGGEGLAASLPLAELIAKCTWVL